MKFLSKLLNKKQKNEEFDLIKAELEAQKQSATSIIKYCSKSSNTIMQYDSSLADQLDLDKVEETLNIDVILLRGFDNRLYDLNNYLFDLLSGVNYNKVKGNFSKSNEKLTEKENEIINLQALVLDSKTACQKATDAVADLMLLIKDFKSAKLIK